MSVRRQVTLELKNGDKSTVEFSSGGTANAPFAAVKLDGEPWVFEFPPWLYDYLLEPLDLKRLERTF